MDRSHVVIGAVTPLVDGGRYRAKSVVGAPIEIGADVFAFGHEGVRAHLRWRRTGSRTWLVVPMTPGDNDRFTATIAPIEAGLIEFEILGEVDRLGNWRHDAERRVAAAVFDPEDAIVGAELLSGAAHLLATADRRHEAGIVGELSVEAAEVANLGDLRLVLDACHIAEGALRAVPPTAREAISARAEITVGPTVAGFSSWYECFPRSTSGEPGVHGTFKDLIGRLDYIADLGFDVLYLPPIHPIGVTARKGPNNSTTPGPDDVGSPWAIGSREGGHTAIHPELGTIDDFDVLVAEARQRGLEIALDLAFQCSPDHPWVTEHPSWFAHRSDGTIACAENPPKRYEDIYPIDFDSLDKDSLYEALLEVAQYWIGHGITVFRVDNPHTKPFAFWEWFIGEIKLDHPEAVFLSEAFTRPRVMHQLAKVGFDQSYTYFTWRTSKHELTEYFEELAHGRGAIYLRPNAWPNTPDILAGNLQYGGRPQFVARLVLAAALSSNYGIYGPVFELMLDVPAKAGTDGDYLDSEKYELRVWDLDDPHSLSEVIRRVNGARRTNRAFANNASLRFHSVENEQLICFSKLDPATRESMLCIVNLDPFWTQAGFVDLDLAALGLSDGDAYQLKDHLDGASYTWTGKRNFVMLDPNHSPAHLFTISVPGRPAIGRERAPEAALGTMSVVVEKSEVVTPRPRPREPEVGGRRLADAPRAATRSSAPAAKKAKPITSGPSATMPTPARAAKKGGSAPGIAP
jgi:starch synthase (maltosyl-transferring)